jgi:hypothetical protein
LDSTYRHLRLTFRFDGSILILGLFSLSIRQTNREEKMTEKKKKIVILPRKIYWHLYSLQNLNSEKFIKVVDKILRSEYQLIK